MAVIETHRGPAHRVSPLAWGLALGLLAVPYYGVVLFPVDSFADAAAWIVSAQLLGVWGETEKHSPPAPAQPPTSATTTPWPFEFSPCPLAHCGYG